MSANAEIYFNNSCSKYNKQLVDYLTKNLESLITVGKLQFNFEIVSNSAKLKERNITRLPALIVNSKTHIGVDKIISYLNSVQKVQRKSAFGGGDGDGDEMLHEYNMSAMGNIKMTAGKLVVEDNDDDDDSNEDLKARLNMEVKRREAAGHKIVEEKEMPQRNNYRTENNTIGGHTSHAPQKVEMLPYHGDGVTDNIGDPISVLKRSRPQNSEQQRDDILLETLLNKIGGDD